MDDEERVIGLEVGADDYVTKPFRPRELMARVRAVLRRSGSDNPAAKMLRAQDVVLDREERTVRVGDQYVDLTPSEFDLLAALMSSPGRVYSRLDLLDIIQGVRYEGYERTIDTHIKNLRAKIEPNPRDPRYIETLYGAGYRFEVMIMRSITLKPCVTRPTAEKSPSQRAGRRMGSCSGFRIQAPASRAATSAASSTASTASTRRAPANRADRGWDSPSPNPSSRPTADRCGPRANRATD